MPEATVTAALVVIGNEILSGRTRDVNVAYLARQLTAMGINLAEVRMVRDEERAIIAAVNTLRAAHDYVFTTGGIGPTHDDITCEAVARAFNLPYRVNPEAKRILEAFYAGTGRELNEARMRMAHTPEGASLIENPVSGAPGFRVENVHVLAGIPAVMRGMFESVAPTLEGGRRVKSREVAVLLGEGDVAARLEALQARYPALEIGSYPFVRDGAFGTTLVLRGTDEAEIARAAGRALRRAPRSRRRARIAGPPRPPRLAERRTFRISRVFGLPPHLTPALSSPAGRRGRTADRAAGPNGATAPARRQARKPSERSERPAPEGYERVPMLAGRPGPSYRVPRRPTRRPLSPRGGIGRRDGLKIRWPSGRPGSSPGAGTNTLNESE